MLLSNMSTIALFIETTWELPAVPVPQSLRQAKSPTDLTPENGLIPNSLSRHSLSKSFFVSIK